MFWISHTYYRVVTRSSNYYKYRLVTLFSTWIRFGYMAWHWRIFTALRIIYECERKRFKKFLRQHVHIVSPFVSFSGYIHKSQWNMDRIRPATCVGQFWFLFIELTHISLTRLKKHDNILMPWHIWRIFRVFFVGRGYNVRYNYIPLKTTKLIEKLLNYNLLKENCI